MDGLQPAAPTGRGVYANRTLNMRSIQAIGYDMDYTLVHYHVDAWERRAYERTRDKLAQRGWPVAGLELDPALVIRGLLVDTELGNLVKANRFGWVKRAFHGTRALPFEEQRQVYQRAMIDLGEARFQFLNTLFSISEACLYAQLVDLLDRGELPKAIGYGDLARIVSTTLGEAHVEGELKAEVVAAPERFIDHDPDLRPTLEDQRAAGKKLLLITNSEWGYTDPVLRHVLGPDWRSLFDVAIVAARKPAFFTERQAPLFEVVDPQGLLRPAPRGLTPGGTFLGGCATQVEKFLGLAGDQILYVGDHLFSDAYAASKHVVRWRTALVLRELEDELRHVEAFRPRERELERLMEEKARLEEEQARLRLLALRRSGAAGPEAEARLGVLRRELARLDEQAAPLARESAELGNAAWGLLMRTGSDKSLLARQVERHADVYTSRVSNLLHATPFAYLRAHRGSLPHDPPG